MRFEGKVAVISAAGAGIGRATAVIVGREGGTVVAVDVEQAALDRLTGEIGAAGGPRGAPTPSTPPRSRTRSAGRWMPTAASTSSSMRWGEHRRRPTGRPSAYATAKGGIIALTRKLAFELGPHGIAVNAIAPSLTLSERIRPHWERRAAEAQAAEIKRVPLGRVATPEAQARVICFLASADADFVTGVTIDVTGGQ